MQGSESRLGEPFSLGDWQVLPSINRLRGPQGETQLEPKAMAVLLVLAQHPGEVVPRGKLHDLAWPDATVSEETLSRAVFDLRKALGDRADSPAYIETIRKVGYRLIAPIRPLTSASSLDAPDRETSGSNAPDHGLPSPAEDPRLRLSPHTLAALLLVGLALIPVVSTRTGSNAPDLSTLKAFDPPRTSQLTSYPGYETHPAISPDGRELAFSWDGGGGANVDLYRRALEGETPIRLTEDPARDDNPQWSPDGRHLVFVRTQEESSEEGKTEPSQAAESSCRLMRLDLQSEQAEPLVACREAQISPPIWTQDQKGLIYSDRDAQDEPFRLLFLDLGTLETTRLTAPPFGSLGDLYPSLSTDGRRLAFVRATAKSTISTYLAPAIGDIFLLDLADGPSTSSEPARRLSFDNRILTGLAWSDDHQSLSFVAQEEGRGYSIWQMPTQGGEPRLLDSPGGLLRFPTRAPEGRIAYERWDGRTNVLRVGLNGSSEPAEKRSIQASTRSDLNPRWRRDGEKIAFTSARTGNYEIWISEPGGGMPQQLTRFERFPAESPAWSPDGAQLAFEARQDGHSRIYTLDIANGDPVAITATPFDDRAPTWSVDGEWIYFGSNRSGSWQIWRTDTQGRRPSQITRLGGFRALESDHTEPPTLLFSKRDEAGIWRLGNNGDEHLVAPLSPEHWGNWDLVRDTLYFVELQDRKTLIHRKKLPDGPVELAGVVEHWISRETPNLSISPEQDSALLAQFTGLAADLMLLDPQPAN